MPLYEYQCSKCGHRFERIQKFSDRPVTACPKCKGKVEKLLSSPAIQFKGTGWYVTDYGSKGHTKGAGETADDAGKSKEKESKETKEAPAKEKTREDKKEEKKDHKEPSKKKEPAASKN